MFSKRTVKLDQGLHEKAERRARVLGYASVSEYVIHMVESDVNNHLPEKGDDAVTERLKGLGYING